MLYLVVYNAYYGYGEEWFTKGIFDSTEKAESMAKIICNEIFEECKKRDPLDVTTKENIMKNCVNIIPLTINQIYESSTVSIYGNKDYIKDYIGDDNE